MDVDALEGRQCRPCACALEELYRYRKSRPVTTGSIAIEMVWADAALGKRRAIRLTCREASVLELAMTVRCSPPRHRTCDTMTYAETPMTVPMKAITMS
ncbi:hypothetical protein VFPFJ_10532 [Purpureocillium lilacinum]|uniref:Uncharacterized protein n=1 Tax=Purpureocillium lilacinum TaxID=33203 RepID=A0A179GH40_PURLI|nr:hypothetical protein VFPFJ_10532 [Purpureocillium lilacinum]OAQ69327.1 hypothetical protein VFPBJ_10702 [Purpureocillium lilacinum]OAQ76750.1 hypothetical protein VFPFJ_10532 [Purpureocillium lilacinum]